MNEPFVLLAGATGDLGGRIAAALVARGHKVRALLHPGASSSRGQARLEELGVDEVVADLSDVESMTEICVGARTVVSALSGRPHVILDRQSVLLEGAGRAGVPRFISSDYSSDYTRSAPGHNRNFDLRRKFAERADRAPIAVTSIFNGAFMDMLGAEMPIIQPRIRSVLYWGDRNQPLNFTTKDDTAAYTADVALDDETPRILRIAGDTVTAQDIASLMSQVSGSTYRTLRVGGVGSLRALIPSVKLVAPQKPDVVDPYWQRLQYALDMFTGDVQFQSLDNDRYPELRWTSLLDWFTSGHLPTAGR